jgi:hypothetical protein
MSRAKREQKARRSDQRKVDPNNLIRNAVGTELYNLTIDPDAKDAEAELIWLYDNKSRYCRDEHQSTTLAESIYEPIERIIFYDFALNSNCQQMKRKASDGEKSKTKSANNVIAYKRAEAHTALIKGINQHMRSKEECFGEILPLAPYQGFYFANTRNHIYTYDPHLDIDDNTGVALDAWTDFHIYSRQSYTCHESSVIEELEEERERIEREKGEIEELVEILRRECIAEPIVSTIEVLLNYHLLNNLYLSIPLPLLDRLPIAIGVESFSQPTMEEYLKKFGYASDTIYACAELKRLEDKRINIRDTSLSIGRVLQRYIELSEKENLRIDRYVDDYSTPYISLTSDDMNKYEVAKNHDIKWESMKYYSDDSMTKFLPDYVPDESNFPRF